MAHAPEILAPAGDHDALKAALAAGADAVYFGLDEGFNARARAANFPLAELHHTVARVHRAGAKAYVTLNTLVFERELPLVERIVRGVAAAGVDAIIVQDPAVVLLARAICPQLDVHASTQMTVASPAAAAFAKDLGCNRVVVPRELSIAEIRKYAAGTDLELEVFVHGALCMSWSGQCLTSEAWGGRSANRGQCAQSCRLPYELYVDDVHRETGDVKYLLSPRDLAGAAFVPDLAEIGVASLKIEGRQKKAEYVSTAVETYRKCVDALSSPSRAPSDLQAQLDRMAITYSRGFSPGFFGGSDHQELVPGKFPKHRGRFVGEVLEVRGDDVIVDDQGGVDLRPGFGIGFDAGDPSDKNEPGGPLFRISKDEKQGTLRLGFGKPGPDLRRVQPGQRVWATSDPRIAREVEAAIAEEPTQRIGVALVATGTLGEPLQVTATAGKAVASARSRTSLAESRGDGLGEQILVDKLGAFGGTPFRLASLVNQVPPGLHLPVSDLRELRRQLAAELLPQIERGQPRTIAPEGAVERIRATLPVDDAPIEPARIIPLVRTDDQLEAAIEAGVEEVELDWMELVGLSKAVERARAAGLSVTVATLRITKPGEEPFDDRIRRLNPDAILVRHLAALERMRVDPAAPVLHGDFSLNATNAITGRTLLRRGLSTLTAAYDLDADQLTAWLDAMPRGKVTAMIYHRIPTFHAEHCLYSHLLSDGKDFRTCGRPCEQHRIDVRDAYGRKHPVIVDAGCRNTVFNHRPQSAAKLVPGLLNQGVRRFRVEFVREDRATTRSVIQRHAALVRGEIDAEELLQRVDAIPQYGVAVGPMAIAE